MECFNCLKQGFCRKTLRFDDPRRKPLNFCETLCMEVYIREQVAPINLEINQKALESCSAILEVVKKDTDLFVFKKGLIIEKMLRISLASHKPKKECLRLYDLYKECATDTLQDLADMKDVEEMVVLIWAQTMKQSDKTFPSLIESLAS